MFQLFLLDSQTINILYHYINNFRYVSLLHYPFQMPGYKDPPKFDGVNFTQWEKEVKLWSKVSKVEKKNQAIAVALSLNDTARSVACVRRGSVEPG